MLQPDTLVQGRFRIIRQIGKGGMGTVYLARDENLGGTVAVKQNFFDDAHLIEAFKRESRLLAGLRHSALPQVKDYFINDTGQYLVMEYIAGDDFGALLDKRKHRVEPFGEDKPFEVSEVVQWAEQLLDALDYLHTRPEPVIHRDIKPQNLKLAERNQIILLDFGLAKGKPQWMTQVTTTGSLYGYTPNYAPIEQTQGAGTDPRSDLYALGATLYHMITGTPPVDATTRADVFLGGEPDPLRPANEVNPQVPCEVAAVLMKAMEQHRNNRPATAAEMLQMLRTAKYATVLDRQAREAAGQERETEVVVQVADPWPTEIETHKRLGEEQKRRVGAEQQRQQEEEARQAQEEAERKARAEQERRAHQEAERQKQQEEAERQAREEVEALRQQEESEKQARAETETLTPQGAPLWKPQGERRRDNAEPRRKRASFGISIGLALIGVIVLVVIIMSRTSALKELTSSFVPIPAGEFMMGSENGDADEKPVHRVRISRSFEMSKYELTQAQWEAVMGSNPSQFKGANLPVEQVSWDDVQQFIQKLNARSDGYVYRLPTEAEWEYACRAGTTTVFAFGDSLSSEQANFDGNYPYENALKGKYLARTVAVGSYQPNAWGLYDMHGNVWEWCQDWYGSDYYAQSPSVDPTGPSSGSYRVLRGGSWFGSVQYLRSADRFRSAPGTRSNVLGFRLMRTLR